MTLFQPVEDPRSRRRASWVFDGLLALFVEVLSLPAVLSPTPVWPVGLVVLPVMLVCLLFRRVWPLPVFVGLWSLASVVGFFDVHASANFALLVALFTVASVCTRRVTLFAASLLEIGAVVASVVIAGGQWWISAIFLTGMVAAATGLGLYRGTRQAYLIELQDRAERLERERDQQGALAAAAERARIAREMHDVVAHHLTVMVALSDGAVAASAASPARAAEVMRTVSATGREALADTRRLLGVLRDDTAGSNGAAARAPLPELADLDALVARVREAGLPVNYEIHGAAEPVPVGVQLTVYRLVQEALTNTLKHGGDGAHATVRLSYLPGEVGLEVEDDGVGGGSSPSANGTGRGLAGMRERVQACGGVVTAGPRAAHSGWRVAARVRLDEAGRV